MFKLMSLAAAGTTALAQIARPPRAASRWCRQPDGRGRSGIVRSYALRFSVLVAAVLGIAAPRALAPPPPPPPPGTIFYMYDGILSIWAMDTNGGNQTQPGGYNGGSPSNLPHNGFYWFVGPRNTSTGLQVFAFREDWIQPGNNTPETIVQLTNDSSLDIWSTFNTIYFVPGDEKVSFKARRWVDGEVVEGGVYTVAIQYDSFGNLVGSGPPPTTPDLAFPLQLDGNGILAPAFRTYGWDPTATMVVYTDLAHHMFVADLLLSTDTLIYNAIALYPQWSPDGLKIAFSANSDICTINPNATGFTQVIKKTNNTTFNRPFWSPLSDWLVCYGTKNSQTDVYRAKSSNGSSLKNLTSTNSQSEAPEGWR